MRLYNNECTFYLERRAESIEGGITFGPYLKYGPKRKPVQACIDLSMSSNDSRVELIKSPGSKTKFQIVTPDAILKLKAATV